MSMSESEEKREKIQLGEVRNLDTLPVKEQIKVRVQQKEITQGQALIEIVYTAVELFVTESSEVYATIKVRNVLEHVSLESGKFRKWLLKEYYDLFEKAPSSSALKDSIETVIAKEEFSSDNIKNIAIRSAEKNEELFIDLANKAGEAVVISKEGWRVIENSEVPINFIRPNKILEMPIPKKQGDINKLREFLNIQGEQEWILLVSFILTVLRGRGPFPVLIYQGLSGSGKSTHSRIIKRLVDPSSLEIATLPNSEEDLLIAARESSLLVFDNISAIKNEASDNLCRLATGAGISTRTLFSNGGEFIHSAMRPVIVNGIDYIAHRSDLASRAIIINLPSLSGRRLDERTFWKRFDEVKADILGAFFDVLSRAICDLPSTSLPYYPRLADFALLSSAAEKHFGFEKGAFLAALEENQSSAAVDALEESLLGIAIKNCLKTTDAIEGTAYEILSTLKTFVSQEDMRYQHWVPSNQLKNSLERLQPTLVKNGMQYEYIRKKNGRIHRISKVE